MEKKKKKKRTYRQRYQGEALIKRRESNRLTMRAFYKTPKGIALRRREKERAKALRLAWIEANGGCCKLCASTDRLQVKLARPVRSDVWKKSLGQQRVELIGATVLCKSCFQKEVGRLVSLRRSHSKHGYLLGCRCLECKMAYRLYTSEEELKARMNRIERDVTELVEVVTDVVPRSRETKRLPKEVVQEPSPNVVEGPWPLRALPEPR